MKRKWSIGLAALLAGCITATAFGADVQSLEAATEGLSSKKERGVVSIAVDPNLSDGRLVFKVVGFNKTELPVSFEDDSVKVFTGGGKVIDVVPLEKLIAQVRGERKPSDRALPEHHDPSQYGNRPIPQDSVGRPDVAGYTGSGATMTGVPSRHTEAQGYGDVSVSTRMESAGTKAQVEALKAAILQPKPIAPSSAGGGQVVTEKLRFGRKEERTVKVLVKFVGEEHEFNFVPPGGK